MGPSWKRRRSRRCLLGTEAYRGFRATQGIAIEAEGSGAWAKGKTKPGRIKTADWKRLYQVYNIPTSESWDVWIAKFKHDTSHGELKEVFKQGGEIDSELPEFEFQLQGNDLGITSVFVGFRSLKLEYQGQTKIYTAPNKNNAQVKNQDGSDYPGGFKPV